jgi:predicted flap endonuclease-1-like 5' DNA nuclease
MEVGLFVLGILIGVGLTWYLLDRYRADDAQEREANFQSRLAAMQGELRDSDAALTETKDRLIALQMEQRAQEARAKPMEADLAQARRATEQALEQATRLRERCTALEDEVARLKGQAGGASPVAPTAMPANSAPKAADDLTLIKGIGKVLARKLHELGITSFRELAELSPADAHRINGAIEFPGRVEREHWIEQARSLAGAP